MRAKGNGIYQNDLTLARSNCSGTKPKKETHTHTDTKKEKRANVSPQQTMQKLGFNSSTAKEFAGVTQTS